MMTRATLRAAVYGRESQAKARSIDDQIDLGVDVVHEHGWALAGTYDDRTSASRYGTKTRGGWQGLLDALHNHALDVLVLWEASRGSRQLGEWTALLDACRDSGVLIHLVGDDRTYDPRKASDRRMLASAGVEAEYETGRLSERSQRGVNRAVRKGRPPMGKNPYGYRRVYDPDTGELAGQEPDPATAPEIVRLFERVAAGASIGQIARELGWTQRLASDRLRNPAYAGLRRHRKQGRNGDGRGQLHDGAWPAIVSPELWHDVQAVLEANSQAARRPARQRHLLSGLAACSVCQAPVQVRTSKRRDRYDYRCTGGHVLVDEHALDDLVEAVLLEALASDAWHAKLRQQHERTSRDVQAARDELANLRTRLDDIRSRVRRGTLDLDDYEAMAPTLKADIAAAETRAETAALPPALRPFVEPGADVEARWDAALLPAKRDVIRALLRIRVQPAGRRGVPVAERVTITPVEP